MLIIGHRGAADLAPENTLKSIGMALAFPVDMIEIDISLCKSGEAVVMHDDRVDNLTDGEGYISDLSLEQLKKLDAGEGERIPTLQEVIDLIDGRCPLNIEIKGRGSAREVARIVKEEVLQKGRSYEDFLVSSFDHIELKKFHEFCSEVRISPIISCLPLSLASLAEEIGGWSLNLKLEYISREIVEDAHRRGLKLLVYTVNRPGELKKLKEMGVDGVFTNNPYALLEKEPK
jgi:glycerophosphoryl diester phosphodiesterase